MIKRRAKKSLHTKPEGKAKPGLVGKTDGTRKSVQRVGRGKPKPGHIVTGRNGGSKVCESTGFPGWAGLPCRLLMLRFDCPNLFGCPNSLRFSKFVSVVQIRFPPQVIHDGGDRSSSSVVAERSSP
jgi:hypothetical protein